MDSSKKISLENYKKAYREIIKEDKKKGFIIHFIVYIIVNSMLIINNLIFSPQKIWFIYPLLGWGIGIAIHYLSDIVWIDKILENKEARAEYRAKRMKTKI